MADYVSQFTGAEIDSRLRKAGTAVQPADLESKQDTLVSGENIKTVNGQSIVGSGNIQIQAGDTDAVKYVEQTLTDAQKTQARTNIGAYQKPASGIPASDIAAGAIPDISGKQDIIPDLSTIRSGAAAGATAYQKPGTGIPSTDMASAVQTSLGKADTAIQAENAGPILPPPETDEFATKTQVNQLEAEVDGSPANYSPGRLAMDGQVYTDEYADGWFVCNDFISVQNGDSLSWLSGENSTNGRYCLRLYGEDKLPFSDGYWNCNTQPKTVTISGAYASAKYVKFCFKKKLIDGETDNTTPLTINGVAAFTINDGADGIVQRLASLDASLSEMDRTLDEHTEDIENTEASIRNLENEIAGIDIDKIYDGQATNYEEGRIGTDGNVVIDQYSDGWYHPIDFIPCREGDVLTWTSGENSANGTRRLRLYDENKEPLSDAYWDCNSQPKVITITSTYAAAKYVRFSFKLKKADTTDNTTPLLINGAVAFEVQNYIPGLTETAEKATEALDKVNQLLPTDTEHGIIGENYPSEVLVVENQLQAKLANRFHFIHISDNHGASFGYAQQYLDLSPAKFLINTGDLVADKFADKELASFQTITLATEPTKPVYLALGNHDYSHATSRQAVFDAFIAPTNTHNGTAFDKTYYSLDFATENVKCIVLDMNDGWADADLPNYGPSGNLTWGKMSQAQINWLATQLQDAITNALHVVIFIHTPPAQVSRFNRIKDFSDTIDLDYARNLTFLPGLIDAFINGETASFTYDGNNYSFTFASGGHFVSWVCGHEHGDLCGWMDGHENQFIAVVCRPYRDTSVYGGSYDGDKLGVHWNYCTIDTGRKSFAVYRMGQQTTIFGTDRVSFRILYK